ncbi:Calcium-dependent protein kinase 2 [Capsicum chinense]|nr:Calcium-dependent protein kinase 2 [Capsicum chinense]
MGNNCVGPKLANNGFLQSVSAAVWKPNQSENLPLPNEGEGESKSEKNKENLVDSSKTDGSCKQGNPHPDHMRNGEVDKNNKNDVLMANHAEEVKQNKPTHVRRKSSIGLHVESVLGRKTGNLKDVFSLGRKLGQGQFGTTFLCLEKSPGGMVCACKSIAKRRLTTEEDIEDVRREIQIMHHFAGQPSVVQIIGAYEDAVAVHVVMELCAGGELFDRILQRGHYSEKKAAELARVIISEIFSDVVGSPYYVAPEVLRKHYGLECDIWSAGVIIYILLSGVPPFWDETEQGIFEQVLTGELDFASEPWPSISESAKDLVRKMLVRDPKKRLTAHEVLCHPWVRVGGVAPDKPLDCAVLSRLNQFSAMNKLKKIAVRVIAESLSGEEIAGLKEMFKMIDADNSGQLTLEELKTGLEGVGANVEDSEIVSLMQAADWYH